MFEGDETGPKTAREYAVAYPEIPTRAIVDKAKDRGHVFSMSAVNSARWAIRKKAEKLGKKRPVVPQGRRLSGSAITRLLPLDTPVAEVVRIAKETYGVRITTHTVHTARFSMRKKGLGASVHNHSHHGHKHGPKPIGDRSGPRAKRDGSVEAFIAQYPHLNSTEVVELGRRAGIRFSQNKVYKVRRLGSQMPLPLPLRGQAQTTALTVSRREGIAKTPRQAAASSDEAALRSLIVRRGVDWVRDILNESEGRLLAVLEGLPQ